MSDSTFHFRDLITRLAPNFLQGPYAQRFLYVKGLVVDGIYDWCLQGIQARFPTYAPSDALIPIGRDRVIRRGFSETDAGFALRVRRWLDDWRIAGNPFAILEQLRGYLSGYTVRLRTVTNRGTWFTIDETGAYIVQRKLGNWNWDGSPSTAWSQFWVIIYPLSSGVFAPQVTCGSGLKCGTPGKTLGTTATPEQVSSIKEIVRTFKPAGVTEVNTIIAFDSASFDPGSAEPPNPNGTWGSDGIYSGGIKVPARNLTARYFDGTANPFISSSS